MAETFAQARLSNGLKVAVEHMPGVNSAACGFLIRAGARDEPPELAGVSHFLEHMCFKGTAKRSSAELDIAFDEIGADNNAQTGKDQTFYYSWGRSEDLETQLELLADMMRSTLPADEFEIEKQVILEEIASYKDDLASNAHDLLYEQVFSGHPLAWPVLGYEETVSKMTRDQMAGYFEQKYVPDNMLLVIAGDVDPTDALKLAEKYCGQWAAGAGTTDQRQAPAINAGQIVRPMDRFYQQAIVLAFPSASITDPLDETAEAVMSIIGGSNSRFYWNIMQKGLATRVGGCREEYSDFGLALFYGLCEPANAERLLDAFRTEAERFTKDGPEAKELQRVKNMRRTALAAEAESPSCRIGQIADDLDYRGKAWTAEQRLAAVDAVTESTIYEYLDRFPLIHEGFLVSVGPRDWPSDQ